MEMTTAMRGTGLTGWFGVGTAAAALACLGGAGCTSEVAVPIAQNRVSAMVAEPELPMRPLPVALAANPSPDTRAALAAGVSVDARLLVITADGTSTTLAAITTVLGYLGTPYDVFNASTGPALTADAAWAVGLDQVPSPIEPA